MMTKDYYEVHEDEYLAMQELLKEEAETLVEGDRVRVIEPGRHFNKEGVLIHIDRNYCPPCVVVLDEYADKVPELAIRYFYKESLKKIEKRA